MLSRGSDWESRSKSWFDENMSHKKFCDFEETSVYIVSETWNLNFMPENVLFFNMLKQDLLDSSDNKVLK